MMPLYGFLEGDTIGILILAEESETIAVIRDRLKSSATARIRLKPGGRVVFNDQILDPSMTVESSELKPLDRFDVIWG